jgi:hypothetical protein
MRQTLALLLDAYREMNAKRMFWFVLVISGIVIAGLASLGVNAEEQITILGIRTRLPALYSRATLFTLVYEYVGIQIWLAWIAMILAIISTSSMFPDLMTGGSIDLYLSKPLGRLRLFLTKYVAGILFVALQVTVFSIASFIVVGVRGGVWEPKLFLAVPLVVSVFSYLWGVSVLMGVLTRSTLAAALLTIVAWLLVGGIDQAEFLSLMAQTHARHVVSGDGPRLKAAQSQAQAERRTLAATQPSADELRHADRLDQRWHQLETELQQDQKSLHDVTLIHTIAYRIKTLLPKTRETNEVLERNLLTRDDLHIRDQRRNQRRQAPTWLGTDTVSETKDEMRSRSLSWIIGTSLMFELVVMGIAARIFCRRDF